MKTRIAAACLAATLIVLSLSCNWFDSKKEASFDIEGAWIIDSLELKPNSTDSGFLIPNDSIPLEISFQADSGFVLTQGPDSLTGKYHFSAAKDTLYIRQKEDKEILPFRFIDKTRTSFSVMAADSAIYHLRRK